MMWRDQSPITGRTEADQGNFWEVGPELCPHTSP